MGPGYKICSKLKGSSSAGTKCSYVNWPDPTGDTGLNFHSSYQMLSENSLQTHTHKKTHKTTKPNNQTKPKNKPPKNKSDQNPLVVNYNQNRTLNPI